MALLVAAAASRCRGGLAESRAGDDIGGTSHRAAVNTYGSPPHTSQAQLAEGIASYDGRGSFSRSIRFDSAPPLKNDARRFFLASMFVRAQQGQRYAACSPAVTRCLTAARPLSFRLSLTQIHTRRCACLPKRRASVARVRGMVNARLCCMDRGKAQRRPEGTF